MPRLNETRYRSLGRGDVARSCSICIRHDAGSINELLNEGRSARSVAAELGLSEDALQRHAQRHTGKATSAPVSRNLLTTAVVSNPPPAAPSDDPLDELVEALRAQALAGNPAIVHQYRLA